MSSRFATRKRTILAQLEAPDDEYRDLSPKGSIDEPIRSLISDISRIPGLVTTSSCSGRVSVFLEGRKSDATNTEAHEQVLAGPGGKGGGSWLFISHDPVSNLENVPHSNYSSMFGLHQGGCARDSAPGVSSRYIHLKFEPMILHILTASLEDSQRVLAAALESGFRESGALSLTPLKSGERNPMVAVRSAGYSFDAIIGYQNEEGENVSIVEETYLQTLVSIANERFKVNNERIARFQSLLRAKYDCDPADRVKPGWEDAETRKRRMRKEGLARQEALKASNDAKYAHIDQNSAFEE